MSEQKVAFITGAYRGIGFELAKQLGKRGFQVFVTARKKDFGKKAASALIKQGIQANYIFMDVTDPRSIQSAVKVVANLSKRLDLLVNNAAILPDKSDSPLKTNAEEIRQAIETNTIGPFLVSRAFLPLLLKAESPRIINVSSGAGTLSASQTFAPAYSISKTALNAVTNQFAAALANKVAVNAVCPGWVRTEMGGRNAPRSIEEGVDGILWLATEAPSNISGLFFRDRKPIPW